MVDPRGVWSNAEDILTQRLNWKHVFHGSGSEISALDPVTPTSRYAFAGNGNDSVGANNLTANGTPTYGTDGGVYGQYTILNGSSQYFTAANNTVFNVASGDFSIWGFFYRSSDTGAEEALVDKYNTDGYLLYILSTDKLRFLLAAGSGPDVNIDSTSSISTGVWYFFAVSIDESTTGTLHLCNLSTGAYESSSQNLSSQSGGFSNTATFTVGARAGGGSGFFPGRIDHLNVLLGTAITSAQVEDIISNLHGGQLAVCHGTGDGFTTGFAYMRNPENTDWLELADAETAQTISASKTFSAAQIFNNNTALQSKDSGGTARNMLKTDGSNNLLVTDDAAGYISAQTDNGSGAGNLVERLRITNGAVQGSSGITYYEPLSSGHVDAGLVNPLFHNYGRQHIYLNNLDLWGTAVSGTGAVTQNGAAIKMTTGASGTSYARIRTNTKVFTDFGKKFEFHALVKLGDIDSMKCEIGLTDQTGASTYSGDNDDFAVFVYDSSVSGNWYTRTNDNGATAPAAADTGTAVSTNNVLLSIIGNETNIKFYIDGTLEATVSTDLPTAGTSIEPAVLVTNLAGDTATVDVFYVELWADIA